MMRVWLWPMAIGVLVAVGLGAGLMSDGSGDLVAWAGLGVPVLVAAWYGLR